MAVKRGKPFGAKRVTEAEKDVIRFGLSKGCSADDVAAMLRRGRATIYKAIAKMKSDGTIAQQVMELGQLDRCADDRTGV